MIYSKQKEFTFKFGVDQKVAINTLNFKGSTGYVNSIRVNRNGIWYEVILTNIKSQHKGHMHPQKLYVLESMLDEV